MSVSSLDWMVEDAQRLAECRHDHPFAVLGPQPLPEGGWVVRAWVPDAEWVQWISAEDMHAAPQTMETPHHPWEIGRAHG